MTQSELISAFPNQYSIPDRVLLVTPEIFNSLEGMSAQECRIFILVSHGSLNLEIDNSLMHVDENSYIDMLVWEPVRFLDLSDDLKGWCLFPNYIFTNESLNELKPADSESFKDRHVVPLLKLNEDETGILENQLQLLGHSLARENHFYRAELCQTYFRSFMLEAGNIIHRKRNPEEEREGVENRQDTILREFLRLVWKYYKVEHNIDFYAGKLCLSSKHLSRVVSGKLGKTPYAVIRDELLQRASFLLKETKMPIQEISSDLHFSEMAAFCKFFKKHHGMSPTAFRTASQIRGIGD